MSLHVIIPIKIRPKIYHNNDLNLMRLLLHTQKSPCTPNSSTTSLWLSNTASDYLKFSFKRVLEQNCHGYKETMFL